MVFYGTQGTLKVSLNKYEFFPKKGNVERGTFLKEDISDLERQEERFAESTATCIMANNAMSLGRSLKLDTKTGRPIDDEEATATLARQYRAPWVHPTADNV